MARILLPRAGVGGGTTMGAAEAKRVILAALRAGFSVAAACNAANRSVSSFQYYREHDSVFADRVKQLRQGMTESTTAKEEDFPDFPTFCREYLDTELFRHQLQWYDMLEGRDPRDVSSSQIYRKGDRDMLLINTPPEHAKSTTITVNYVTWRICQDPNIRVLIISKTQEMAKKFLVAIKDRLAENDSYHRLQGRFGPPGGFHASASAWTADKIYVSGKDSGEKDPTVWALGIKGQVYGARADLAILDDCVDHTNHQDYVKQIDWLQNMVGSRVADAGGKILVVGTRIESVDLYSELLKPEYYSQESSPWTYLTQPAVEEYAEDSRDWVTLWPKTNRAPVTIQGRKLVKQDDEGRWPMWDGRALARKRARMSPRNWSLVYQQEQVADDSVFPTKDVVGCIDEARYAGRMFDGQSEHRRYGMEGLFVVAGLDPADVGHTAAVVIGLDRQTGVRWVMDIYNKRGCRPHEMREMIKSWTDRYRVTEWRIEKNAFQGSIVQDEDLRTYLHGRGALMTGHFTGGNKWDPNFGVASMATLFKGHEDGRNLIRLPSRYQSEGSRALVEQLTTWNPVPMGTRAHTGHWDTVMALWFAEIRCRELMQGEYASWHLGSEFTSERDNDSQMVVDLDYAIAQGGLQPWDGTINW